MSKKKLRVPFFTVNPKSYLFGQEALDFAIALDKLAAKYDVDILYTCQHADIYPIAQAVEHLFITAQHMDGHQAGRGMGKILPESIQAAGAVATFLNHAEHPMTLEELVQAMKRADELDILTIVCANSIAEAQTIATLAPDLMVCEPTELIGTGQTSDVSYMQKTNEAVRAVNPNILLLQAAGISTVADVQKALESGADATGGTSGIVAAADPLATAEEMLACVAKFKEIGRAHV